MTMLQPTPMSKLPMCITPKCTRLQAPALKTGLCMQCHSKAKKLVESGRTTWENLVQLGLALPVAADDPFTRAFNELTKETQN